MVGKMSPLEASAGAHPTHTLRNIAHTTRAEAAAPLEARPVWCIRTTPLSTKVGRITLRYPGATRVARAVPNVHAFRSPQTKHP